MAPTPWTPTHRLDIELLEDGLHHVIQIGVDAVASGGGNFDLIRATVANRPVGDCVDDFIAVAKALYAATSSFTGYTLYQHLGANIFAPVFSDSRAVVGTHAGPTQHGWGFIVTYRDIDYKIAKFVLLETAYGALFHLPYPTTDGSIDAFVASTLPASAGGNSIWEFWRSRGGVRSATVRFITISPNKRVRRKRGLV